MYTINAEHGTLEYIHMTHPIIILPTYNEKENLQGIVDEIFGVGVPDLRILIVDDNSPDGTGVIADRIASSNSMVRVLHRPEKQGLGRAYVDGFREALRDPEAAWIFEMDADFSHQPKYIPHFLIAAERADIVLGTRYMPGGGVENWHWFRRLISWSANTLIRTILGMRIRDLTSGFKCFRREVLERLDLEAVSSRGYNFQIEVSYRSHRAGFRISEIPIIFVERRAGKSKFSAGIILESFLQVLRLRFKKI